MPRSPPPSPPGLVPLAPPPSPAWNRMDWKGTQCVLGSVCGETLCGRGQMNPCALPPNHCEAS